MDMRISYVVIIALFVVLIATLILDQGFTGFIVYENSVHDDFNGIYENTEYNSSGFIELSPGNLSGTYTSQIFDGGGPVFWSNVTWQENVSENEYLLAVDASGSVYASPDFGITWTEQNDDYGRGSNTRDMFYDQNYLYIIFSNGDKEVYRSSDMGVNWNIINDSFTDRDILVGDSDSDSLYIINNRESVLKSIDSGETWKELSDFNGDNNNNPNGIAIDSNGVIYVIDVSESVWVSNNSGVNWTEQIDDYGGSNADGMVVDSSNNLYILSNKDIYKSNNSGSNWTLINDRFSPYSQNGLKIAVDANDNLYIIDDAQRVFESTDLGINWTEINSDFNGGVSNDVRGFTNFMASTDITFQFRSCDDSSCSGEEFAGPDGTSETHYTNSDFENLNISYNRYFQYKTYLTTSSQKHWPKLYNLTMEYVINHQPPATPQLNSPYNNTFYKQRYVVLNASSSDPNNDSITYNFYGNGELINTTIVNSGANAVYNWTGLGLGEYNWNVVCSDGIENSNMSEIRHFTIYATENTTVYVSKTCFNANCPDGYDCDSQTGMCVKTVYRGVGRVYIENETRIEELSQQVSDLEGSNEYLQSKIQMLENENEAKTEELNDAITHIEAQESQLTVVSTPGLVTIIILIWTSLTIGYRFKESKDKKEIEKAKSSVVKRGS